MSRYFSFGVLLAVIVLLIIMFYKLMVGFFVPLFLAALLVVIFNPLHQWFLKKFKGHGQIAAGLTTTTICLVVFAPMALVFMLAASEGRMAVQNFSSGAIINQLVVLRQNLGLDIVAVEDFRSLENEFTKLVDSRDPESESKPFLRQLDMVQTTAETFREAAKLPVLPDQPGEDQADAISSTLRLFRSDTPEEAWLRFQDDLLRLRDAFENSLNETTGGAAKPAENPDAQTPPPADSAPDTPEGGQEVDQTTVQDGPDPEPKRPVTELIRETKRSLDLFKTVHTGGKTWSWLKLMANPTDMELEEYSSRLSTFLREKLLTIGGATTAALGSLLFGLAIMIVAVYFFLLDGPAMLAAIKHVSPLDKTHDDELIQEFSTVSRAVVLATLLSALAQGILAGIGLWYCGFEQVFLMTILTTCLALVPFIGAAAVWVPACIWLYAMDGRLGAAIGLAIYGTAVISMVDNFIKPWVLHGQSNLHPLVALLSVLGGVTALGPVGILIGPMIVAFLQTTLEILRKELSKLDVPAHDVAAESGSLATVNVASPAPVPAKPSQPPNKPETATPGKFRLGKKKKQR